MELPNLLLPAMVLYKNWMAHHDVAKGSNSDWHQPVQVDEQVEEEGVQQAGGGEAQQAPGRLKEGCVQAGGNIEDAVIDDDAVDSCSLLPQDADAGPQVDCKGDQCDLNICKKVNHWLCHIHLNGGSHSFSKLKNTFSLSALWAHVRTHPKMDKTL